MSNSAADFSLSLKDDPFDHDGHHYAEIITIWTVFVAGVIMAVLWLIIRSNRHRKQLPPRPFRWPLVGCLPSVGFKHRHRTFYQLSKKYGPIMHIPIGAANFIVIHGPAMAEELLKTQDAQFCSRPLSMTGQYLGFDHQDLNLSPYNSNWKAVRKAFSTELLSPARLSLQAPMRREEVRSMIHSLWQSAQRGEIINLTRTADDVTASIIVRMLFGKRYGNPDIDPIAQALQNFEADLREGIFLWGELNLADFFPALARWDLQGLERRFKRLRSKLEGLFKLIIDEHREHPEAASSEQNEDSVHVLLSQNQLSEKQLMGIMSNTLIAGIDTTSRAIEWAMAELVTNPDTMRKAQEELDRVVGRERLMNESDIPELPYLQAIAKEALRLHPSAPLDDPHLNEQPAKLGGYVIPPNSIMLLNLWALGQDESMWDRPKSFNPDRFLAPGAKLLNVYGSHYQLLPFSSGRRRCPAYQLATAKLQHVVGVLLQAFDWKCGDVGSIDMSEGDGIVVGLKVPLMLCGSPRLAPDVYRS